MRQALDDHGTLDRKTRTAILLTTAAADECAYTVALNATIAQQAGWDERETLALRTAPAADPKLASLLAVAGQSARNRGRVEEATWQSARVAGWTDAELAEAFGFVGLAQYVDSFINFAETEPDGLFADAAADAQSGDRAATSTTLTHLLIVEDQDRTRAFYEQVLGASVVRERDPVILHFHNSWIVANVGGLPTDDKPQVTMAPPSDPNSASSALNVRVADARATYEEWRARGGHFLTPPVERGGEIRCYLRDPDGHLIEVGEILPARPSPR
ncbi:MAG: VOC family protein [Chloroflexi bacterium]|nr:VOC family protein [Chloroflexota bacterium]